MAYMHTHNIYCKNVAYINLHKISGPDHDLFRTSTGRPADAVTIPKSPCRLRTNRKRDARMHFVAYVTIPSLHACK